MVNRIPGTVKKRLGASKSLSGVNDICSALKVLAEKDSLPIFLVTSEMIKETPILKSYPADNDRSKINIKRNRKINQLYLDKNNGNMKFSINNQRH